MGIGRTADAVAGQLSKVLHAFRGPEQSHAEDLAPYLGHSADELFPEPEPLEDVYVHRTAVDRLLRSSTLRWQSTHRVLCPRYRARHEGPYRRNLTAWARWIRPARRTLRRRCLVYVHGWLEPGSWVEEGLVFPRWVRELDVDIVHVSLPFHGKRNPPDALFSGEYFWTADLVRTIEGVRQAVHDTRSIMGWLERQGYGSVGATGMSLGGSIVMMLACVRSPPDFIIPIVAHTQVADAVERASILFRMKKDLERFGMSERARRSVFERLGLGGFRPVLAPHRQLWIEAADDAHIEPESVRRQWEAWGRPPVHWIPGGHMTFPLFLPRITRAMQDFLRELP